MIKVIIEIDGKEALFIENEEWDGDKSTMIDEAITLLQRAKRYKKEVE